MTPWTAAQQVSLSFTISPEFAQIHIHWVGGCCLAISSSAAPFFCLQSFPVSGSFPVSRLFTSVGQSIPLQHQSSNSGLISFRIDWWSYEIHSSIKYFIKNPLKSYEYCILFPVDKYKEDVVSQTEIRIFLNFPFLKTK